MTTFDQKSVTLLRIVIGYLGEKDHFDWWHSSFYSPGSNAFLKPIFGRTQLLAQCSGVTQAAALVHDERIGIGNVYHLFRLPEEMEQGIHRVLGEADFTKTSVGLIASRETALSYLHKFSAPPDQPGVGPTRVGKIDTLRQEHAWQVVAGLYYYAFEAVQPIFPYFSEFV